MGVLVKIHNAVLGVTLGFILGSSWEDPRIPVAVVLRGPSGYPLRFRV